MFLTRQQPCCRGCKVPHRFKIVRLSQGDLAAQRRGLRDIEGLAFQRPGLEFLDVGEDFIRFADFAILDRLVRLRLQGGDVRIMAGLSRGRQALFDLVVDTAFIPFIREAGPIHDDRHTRIGEDLGKIRFDRQRLHD